MALCEVTEICVFFNEYLPKMKSVAEGLKDMYCRDDNSECARFTIYKALGIEAVPQALFPNEVDKATLIIIRAQK
jgi:hypothetical protein